MHMCPVCGYIGLNEQTYDDNGCASYEICSCCGFEFGFVDNDQGKTLNGTLWSNEKKKPEKWNLKEQLKNIEKLG